ncbi:MAG: flagellar biosynthesis protein FlhB [Spirochaetaceae bacterium]|nr:MAG: flagellar biosynthesis protein FlhB [Spirochaetaceae bacterium]
MIAFAQCRCNGETPDRQTQGRLLRHRQQQFRRQLTAIHLQWFAAEDEGRTEDPTEHKIRKAREEGKVAKSQDVTGAVVLLFSVLGLGLLGGYILELSREMVQFYVGQATAIDVTADARPFAAFYHFFVRLTIPVGAIAFVAAVMGSYLQVGALFTLKPITPDFNRVAPNFPKFFKRAFASAEAGFNLTKALGKIIIIVLVAFLNIRNQVGRMVNLVHRPFMQSLTLVAGIAFSILVQVAVILLILSLFDYMFQRRQHIESIKMTREEVKEERKTYEGDPLIKSRLRQRMQEILSRNMVQNVPKADVVVTNPTHFAVALEYNRWAMPAPTVIAKGQDAVAQRIREIAQAHNVPVMENKPLARALYAEVEIGDVIPEKFFEAVVAVLKEVYRIGGRAVKAG